MGERQQLKRKIVLCGTGEDGGFKRTFLIDKRLKPGTSVLCYAAHNEQLGRGILKEFYPRDAYGMERTPDGQLIFSDGFEAARERFQEEKKEYIQKYEMLLQIKRKNEELNTFIPSFEIYYGFDEKRKETGTAYIWSPEPELETFDKICEEIHAHPGKQPEHKLVQILSAMESLVSCIQALHEEGLLHLDIKPSNFGFLKRGKETLTQAISMFDLNSICSIYHLPEEILGTLEYLEPEVRTKRADVVTDIYAIGATLFQAIIVPEKKSREKYYYKSSEYAKIEELIDTSLLIQASESNSHPRLRNALATLLKKSLCPRKERYKNCETFLQDLRKALFYALPSDIAKKQHAGMKWVLTDMEKSTQLHTEKNSTLVMQCHLYTTPLYLANPQGEQLDVFLFGFGNYGQKFLDACLHAGQMKGKKLNVTVISDEASDKQIYLQERPALQEFFNIDGSLGETKESYGTITFQVIASREQPEEMGEIVQRFMKREKKKTQGTPYVFIALGEDRLNLEAAKQCKTRLSPFSEQTCICFCWEGAREQHGMLQQGLIPVYVCEDASHFSIFPELERLAFNAHLVWEKNLNVDYKNVREKFKKKYNHDACIANVLSIKYKLYGIGIDLDRYDFQEAARLFEEKGLKNNKESSAVYNELIAMEHQRWVVEKLCKGWKRMENLEECATGMTKDEKQKRHICIVHSRADRKLATEFSENGNEKWDTASEEELNALDELDRLSVELHRMYVRKATSLKKHNLLEGSNIMELRLLIGKERKAAAAFLEWMNCLRDIWNGDHGRVKGYKGVKETLLKEIENLQTEHKKAAKEQIKAFKSLFYPVLASMEYRDYKQDDAAFIDQIPFILTYSEAAYMVIPLTMGTMTAKFANVAAATIVNPERILYLCYFKEQKEVEEFRNTISYIASYLNQKKLRASVEFIVAYSLEAAPWMGDGLQKEIKQLFGSRLRLGNWMGVVKPETLQKRFCDYLLKRRKGKAIFAVEENQTYLSDVLKSNRQFDSYHFISSKMEFDSKVQFDVFRYIKKGNHIRCTDMTVLESCAKESKHQPEFFVDYKILWAKYCGKKQAWEELCQLLSEYVKQNDVLVTFDKKETKEKEKESRWLRYVIPFSCKTAAENIIQTLKFHKMIEDGSYIGTFTTKACEVRIEDRAGNKARYDRLFANPYSLAAPEDLNLRFEKENQMLYISFDQLIVNQVNLGTSAELLELLLFFEEKGYLIHVRYENGSASFTFATTQIKELLTNAEKIGEIYSYHKAKELAVFDDVLSGVTVDWKEKGIKKEVDCILTKGFRTLFVGCKAKENMETEYNLCRFAKESGINGMAVLMEDAKEIEEVLLRFLDGE